MMRRHSRRERRCSFRGAKVGTVCEGHCITAFLQSTIPAFFLQSTGFVFAVYGLFFAVNGLFFAVNLKKIAGNVKKLLATSK
jgi:hypothetical protein